MDQEESREHVSNVLPESEGFSKYPLVSWFWIMKLGLSVEKLLAGRVVQRKDKDLRPQLNPVGITVEESFHSQQNIPGKICVSWDSLRLSPSPCVSGHWRELHWHWASVGTSAVPLQGGFQPFLQSRLAHQKAVIFKPAPWAPGIQDTDSSWTLKHTQPLLVAPQPL